LPSVIVMLVNGARTGRFIAGLALVALCLVAGDVIARYPPTYVLGLTGLGAAVAVGWWNRGVLTGLLVLLLLEGVPFVHTQLGSSTSQGASALNDAIFVALVALLAFCVLGSTRNRAQDRLATLASFWASCYLAWWLYKIVVGSPGIPLFSAVSFGRDFLIFSLFLPLALLGIRRQVHLVGFATTLAVGAAIFSIGALAEQITHTQLSWLIHVNRVATYAGVTRIFAPMDDLLVAAFPAALAATLLAPRAWRRPAMLLMVLTGLANALSLTRALYASELLAFFLISLAWSRGSGWRPRRIRYTVALGGLAAIAVTVVIAGAGVATTGNSLSPVQAVVSRAALGVTNVQNQTGNVGYRLHEAHLELAVLGDSWVAGLGFLNPAYHYVPSLPEGSIRDVDLGSLSIVMTMGLIGLLLAYMPPIAGLAYLLRRRHSFVQYGGAMYLSAALIGSITLGALATVSGLLVLGSMLVLCLNWTALTSSDT